jgi:tRNA pseudouridine55 synthase
VTPAHAPLHHPEPRDTPTRSEIEQTLAERFTGHIDQRPPDFSAVKVGGRRAYKLARGDEVPTIQPKRVRIDAIDVLRYDWPELELDIRCGKGTYIRSLARDLGLTLGVGGTLTSLVRTAVGRYTLEGAIDPEKTTGAQLEQSLTEPPAPEQQPLSSADDEPGQMNDDTSAPSSTS